LANTGRASGGDGKGCSTSADCPKSKPICFYFGGSGSPRGVCVARVLL
jgi:hypothetical protein